MNKRNNKNNAGNPSEDALSLARYLELRFYGRLRNDQETVTKVWYVSLKKTMTDRSSARNW